MICLESSHYRKQECTFVSVPTVQKVKPRNRFDKIRQYLSLNNRLYTQDDPGYVKLFKVRSLLDRLDSRIHEEYQPSKFISIDEWSSMKEDGFKQYKHMKPVKRGSKVWVRSDATNGFVSAMQVYTGKKSGGQPKHGLGHRDVSDLVSDLMGKNYHIFCDNFFTSVRLAEDLLSDKLHLCGTTLAKLSFVGEENIVTSVWKDKKAVSFIGTQCDARGAETVRRKQKDGTYIEAPSLS